MSRVFFLSSKELRERVCSYGWHVLSCSYFSHSGIRDVKNIRREDDTFSEILTYIFLIKTLMTTSGVAKCKHRLPVYKSLFVRSARLGNRGDRINESNFGILTVSLQFVSFRSSRQRKALYEAFLTLIRGSRCEKNVLEFK